MKLIIEGETTEIMGLMETIIVRGVEPQKLRDQIKMYMDQAAASASRAAMAEKNAIMAAEDAAKSAGR